MLLTGAGSNASSGVTLHLKQGRAPLARTSEPDCAVELSPNPLYIAHTASDKHLLL